MAPRFGRRFKQIEIGNEEPRGVGNPVRNRDNDVRERRRRVLCEEPVAKTMLVHGIGLGRTLLVAAKRPRQKLRLPQQAVGATVVEIAAAERLDDQLLEALHELRLPSQLVVEAKDLGDQPWANLEGQVTHVTRGVKGGSLRHRVALERGQPTQRLWQTGMQRIVNLVAA